MIEQARAAQAERARAAAEEAEVAAAEAKGLTNFTYVPVAPLRSVRAEGWGAPGHPAATNSPRNCTHLLG
jgi:hypothetical protein